MVSKSASLKATPKASLTRSIEVSPLTRKLRSGRPKMSPSSSAMSNSSSISPTICSSTSSIVMRPAVRPNSSITMARWLRLPLNSRSKSFSPLLSGTNTAGRSSALMFSSGARCNFSKSLAIKMPMMFSFSLSYTGNRECAVSMMRCSSSSNGASILTRSMRGAATITSPAVMSAMRITPSNISRLCAPMTSLSCASTRVSISSSLESGPG